jgi:hypothetical protein
MKTTPLVSILALSFLLVFSGCSHNEGTVKYDDCREIIKLDKDSWRLNLYSFTCDYSKNVSGEIMGGICVRIELDDSLFSHTGICKKAYVYTFWNAEKGSLPRGFKPAF